MIRRAVSLIASAVMCMICMISCKTSDYKYETFKDDPLGTRIYTLDNGLKVYMSVNREQPRIQTYIAVKVGGKNDPSETTGLAHYFEHLMFKGTRSFGTSDYEAEKPMLDSIEALFEIYRRTQDEGEREAIYHRIDSISYAASKIAIPNEYDKLMAMIGSDGTNAWTSSDETVYTEDIPSNQIDSWARIQADRFKNTVIRGFHTELETIYEEKNMSLTQDSRRVWEAVDRLLFPHHPYGRQTVLGTQEHLKNPSITNVRKYHDTYYVPDNIAICLSGDFDPDEMVAVIEKYFGDWEPNGAIPELQYEPETPITAPKSEEVVGLEAENLAIAWRLPGAQDLKTSAVASVAGQIMFNGMAGLFDLDIIQQQKALSAVAGADIMPDYGSMFVMAQPKAGQSLEELKDLILEEFSKLRQGDFDEAMLKAIQNNMKLDMMRLYERNDARAEQYVDAFINGIDWKDQVDELKRISGIKKADVVSFANEYLGPDNYVVVYKRQGQPDNVQKIAAPAITPIVTNRDMQSDFLKEMQQVEVEDIEPVFPDFRKDVTRVDIAPETDMLYMKNQVNDIAVLRYVFNAGTGHDPLLSLAFDYLSYLGTEEMTADDISRKMYSLACNFRMRAGDNGSSINVTGLGENVAEAMGIIEKLVAEAKGDESVLESLKADMIKSRADRKLSQRVCFNALNRYIQYGPEFIKATTVPDSLIMNVSSEELLSKVRDLMSTTTEVIYYGPESLKKVKSELARIHAVPSGIRHVEKDYPELVRTETDRVVLAQFDANQIYYQQFSDRGEKFNNRETPRISLYNEYFGGGMNTVVFQEMREARGLAYSAWAILDTPDHLTGDYSYTAFIATQNDKMRTAMEAFDDIINNMPQSEAAFKIAKNALESRLRTQRTTGSDVIDAYVQCRELGLVEPAEKAVFENLQDMTMDDVVKTQEQWVKGRHYTYGILGDIADLDLDYLSTKGKVKIVTLEDIFGY